PPDRHPDLHSSPTRRSSDLHVLMGSQVLATLTSLTRKDDVWDWRGYAIPWQQPIPTHVWTPIAPMAYVVNSVMELFKQPKMWPVDRKSTRLNSSHGSISYAV